MSIWVSGFGSNQGDVIKTSIYCKHKGGSVTDDLQRLVPTKKLDKELPGWYFEYESFHGPFSTLQECYSALKTYLGRADYKKE